MKRVILLMIGVVFMSSCKTENNRSQDMPPSLYKSKQAEDLCHQSYDNAMELWPVKYEENWIETEYGKTHIIVSGVENAPPIFLLPALLCDATMWYSNVESLAKKYRVYAVDSLVYGGKSVLSNKKIYNSKDFANWFKEILDNYSYKRTAIAGLSYSGWLSIALAKEMPDKISSITILDPSTTFMKMDGGIAWRGFWAFVFFPTEKKKQNFFEWMGGGYTDPQMEIWFSHMTNIVNYGNVTPDKVPQHMTYTKSDLSMIKTPTLILIGGKKILYKDPSKLAAKAKIALPHAEVEIIEDAGHLLNIEKAELVNKRIIKFLASNY